jgi:hypothetical protein
MEETGYVSNVFGLYVEQCLGNDGLFLGIRVGAHGTLETEGSISLYPIRHSNCMRRVLRVKLHHVYADREIFYAYYGNTAVDLDPLPVSRARLTVVESTLFE